MKYSTLAAVVLVLMTSTAAMYAQEDDLAIVPRISLSDFKGLIESGDLVILDVRSGDSYRAGHIPGALSMPLADIAARWRELPADKTIVTYCS
ncbi:MAG: rhodanese-like domain-containing protein [Acidobacteria bacterium]|nr:rhodanese-like domain-containing protein [Acidobacteriota bacterium]